MKAENNSLSVDVFEGTDHEEERRGLLNQLKLFGKKVADRDHFEQDKGYAFVIMAICFLILAILFSCFFAFGLFEAYFLEVMFPHETAEKISWIGTTISTAAQCFGMIAGPTMNRLGVKNTIMLGLVIQAIGYTLASFSTKVWELILTLGIVAGFGSAIALNCVLTVGTLWFNKRRTLGLGVILSAGSIGAIIFIPILSFTLRSYGWPWTIRILAILNLVLILPSYAFLKDQKDFKSLNNILDFGLLKDPYLLLVLVLSFFQEIGYTVILFYFQASLVSLGVSHAVAYNTTMVFFATALVGKMSVAFLANRIGPKTLIVVSAFTTGISTLTLWYLSTSLTVSLIFYVVAGLFSSNTFSITPMLIAAYFKRTQISQANALVYLVYGSSILIFGPILGVVFDKLGNRTSFSGVIVIGGASYILSGMATIVLIIFARKRIPKFKTGPI